MARDGNLNGIEDEEEEERLGDELFCEVARFQEELAAKITASMLETMDRDKLNEALGDEACLKENINIVLERFESGVACDTPGAAIEESCSNGAHKGTSFRALLVEVQQVDQERCSLQHELNEAEKWAEGMQNEWNEKEAAWKKRLDELKQQKNGKAEKDAAAVEAQRCNEEAMARLRAELAEIKAKTQEDEAVAKKAEEEMAKAQKAKADAATEEKGARKEIGIAQKWCDDMVDNFKKDLATKTEEVEEMRRNLEELAQQTKAQADAPAAPVEEEPKQNEEEKARCLELEQRLTKAEAEAREQKAKADEAMRRAKTAESSLTEKDGGKKEAAQSKADRCRELQQDLDNAQEELKGYKAQLKQQTEERKASEPLADAQKATALAKERRLKSDERLREAQAEVGMLKGKELAVAAAVPKKSGGKPKKK